MFTFLRPDQDADGQGAHKIALGRLSGAP